MISDLISADLPPFPYPPVSQVHNCATDIVDTNLTVSCDFNNGSVLGYYVLVQFAEDMMLLTGETRDGSPVEFQDLPANGAYNVVVFLLTENGIVGTTVASTEQVTVTGVPTVATTVVSLSPDTTDTTVTRISTSKMTVTAMKPEVTVVSLTLTLCMHVHTGMPS